MTLKKRPASGWAQFFNGHAPEYETNVFTKNTLAEVDFLIKALKITPGMAVLDVGCGTGRHAIELARRGFAVTGLDISAGMLEQARRNAARSGVAVRWRKADARRFSLPNRFDAVVCLCEGACGLLGAGDDPIGQPRAIIGNIARAMKPGARCLFTVLNGYRLVRRHDQVAVGAGLFDPLALAERSEGIPPEITRAAGHLRERGFVPTELVLLFSSAGIEVTDIWGGTAGNWGPRPIDLDEYEIMVVGRSAEKSPAPACVLDTRR